jgi:outer membrane receptor protein involved in Fe transport
MLISVLGSFLIDAASADTRGKLSGRIADSKNSPVVGANILLVGTTTGTTSNEEGSYVILNVPAGVYSVRVSGIGYQAKVTKEVRINAGLTTVVDVVLAEQTIQQDEVTVVAERPMVDTRQTSAVAILGQDDISVMPVQSLTDIVNLQAGVVDGHFRGGRVGEVQYQVDGVSVNNPYDNSSTLQLDKSVLQEVQVVSGTFDAEYGQAMSGVVNAVLRSGSEEKFEVSAESYFGDFVPGPSGASVFPHIGNINPAVIQSYTFTLSGPTGLPETAFLMNLRRFQDDGYLYGERRFRPTDNSDFQGKVFNATGDNAIIPMSTTSEWSWQFKLSNRSLKEIQLNYQAIGSTSIGQAYDFGFRLNPDGRTTQRRFSLVHGIDFTHAPSSSTYYTISLRQNYFNYTDWAFERVDDPQYQIAGPPRSDANYELGAVIQGVSLTRFRQRTNAFVTKASVTSQIGKYHLFKAGVEAQISGILFGSPGTVYQTVINDKEVLVPIESDSVHPGAKTYFPRSLAVYFQDRVEFVDFLIRVGIRLEYFDANAQIPDNLQNPANALPPPNPQSTLVSTSKKIALVPRLGISYPISDQGAIYFSYGHFTQMPGLGLMYSNSDYSILKNLQAGSVNFGVMGNPDLKPEFTTQYEFGVKSQFGKMLGVDLSVFYKDIRDLLGIEFVSTYAAADYARFTNIDFGSVYGLALAYDQRLTSQLTLTVNYTYQKAIGNSSDPYETANRAAAGADPRPRQIPFAWDQTHTVNASLSLNVPDDYSATLILRYGNGNPYTPAVGSGFGAGLEANSARKPSWALVDLRLEKHLEVVGLKVSLFGRVTNLLDARYANGFVFPTTGSSDYSLTSAADAGQLVDPTRYAQPRRIELGISARY